jgi:bla regulator protein blaR1
MSWLSSVLSNIALASLLAVAAWFVQRHLRQHGIARVLWVLVLVKLVTPPVFSVPLRQLPGSVACAFGVCGCEKHQGALFAVGHTLPGMLLAAWSVGAGAMGWIACRRWSRFRRLLAHATPVPAEWQSLALRLSSELAIRRPPELLMAPGRLPPFVVPGLTRPRMLLPIELMDQLSAPQRSSLLLHELAHIKRGDHLVRMLELAVGVAYWWLPVVGSIGRQLRACEETCCDEAVVACLPEGRRDYARLLLDVIDFANPLPPKTAPQVTAMSAAIDVEQRLRAILNDAPRTRCPWAIGALALSCAVLPCNVHFSFAQRSSPATDSSEACEPAAEAILPPGSDRSVELSVFCCPS